MKTILTLIALVYFTSASAELIEQTLPSNVEDAVATHYDIGRRQWDCCGISQIRLFKLEGEPEMSIIEFIKKTLEQKSEMSSSLQAIQSICNQLSIEECLQTLMYYQDDRDWNESISGQAFDGDENFFKAYLTIESFLRKTLSNNTVTKTFCDNVYSVEVCDTLVIDTARNLLVYIAHDEGN
jgi:hypothetical protein